MTSVLVWNIGVASNRTAIHAPRIKTIADVIYIQNPDICVLMDAFKFNTDQRSIAKLFPNYRVYIYPLQKCGNEEIISISYCVLVKKYYLWFNDISNVSITPIDIGNTRFALEIDVEGVKILAAYLEYADHMIRRQQLDTILSLDVDIICGDLNTFFRNVPREYFGNPLRILYHWKQIGLYICSKQVRNMHVPRRVLSNQGWILLSRNQYSFPLPFFWKTFLNTPLLKRTSWIWKTIFNRPVLDPDSVLVRSPDIFLSPVSIITEGIIEEASDHGAIRFEV
jgi:hypothetical protein